MNKVNRLVKVARKIQIAKNLVFASKDLLELLKDPEARKKMQQMQERAKERNLIEEEEAGRKEKERKKQEQEKQKLIQKHLEKEERKERSSLLKKREDASDSEEAKGRSLSDIWIDEQLEASEKNKAIRERIEKKIEERNKDSKKEMQLTPKEYVSLLQKKDEERSQSGKEKKERPPMMTVLVPGAGYDVNNPKYEKKRMRAPKAKEDRTLEEDMIEEEKQLDRWLEKERAKRGLIVLREGLDDEKIQAIKRMIDRLANQPMPKPDDSYAKEIRLGISFANSLLGRASKTASQVTRTIEDFSQQELDEIVRSMDESEAELAQKKRQFREQYGIDLPEGRTWERTLSDGRKVYILTSKQLSYLTSLSMSLDRRLELLKRKDEKLKDKVNQFLSKKDPSKKIEKKDELDLSDEDLDFLK